MLHICDPSTGFRFHQLHAKFLVTLGHHKRWCNDTWQYRCGPCLVLQLFENSCNKLGNGIAHEKAGFTIPQLGKELEGENFESKFILNQGKFDRNTNKITQNWAKIMKFQPQITKWLQQQNFENQCFFFAKPHKTASSRYEYLFTVSLGLLCMVAKAWQVPRHGLKC